MLLPTTMKYVNESSTLQDLLILAKGTDKEIIVHYTSGIRAYRFGILYETIPVSTSNGIIFRPLNNKINIFLVDITGKLHDNYRHRKDIIFYTC